MRQINVRQAKPGLITGREVIDEKGQVLLHRHVPLTPVYIEALLHKGFSRIWVIDPEEEPIVELEDDIPAEVRTEAHLALRSAFEEIEKEVGKLQGDNLQKIIAAFNADSFKALLGSDGPLGQIIEAAQSIMRSVLSRTTLAGLTSIKSKDTFLYEHSVDVCAIALMIGRAAGLKTDRLRQLAAGCLLHDIGKVFLEDTVTGDKEIFQHTTLGYELLRASEDKDILTPHVAYEHHERPDKTGLPRGLRAGNFVMRDRSQPPPIPTALGEIAAVANAYDRLLSGARNRPALRPDEALKEISEGAGTAYNREVVQAFLRIVPVYPLGTEVIVKSERYRNHVGVVTRVNASQLDRPVITLVRDGRGQRMRHTPVDLAAEADIHIRSK
jgi:putative nucleotidyltransferase with HDIG domain